MNWFRLDNHPNFPAFVNLAHVVWVGQDTDAGGCIVRLTNGDCIRDPRDARDMIDRMSATESEN